MPKTSPSYCRTTPVSKMGFTQRASCKAQGILARTSRKSKGKYVKSPKYKRSRKASRKYMRSVKRKYT